MLMRAFGGISKARSSSRPRRPPPTPARRACRCTSRCGGVFPVTSTRRSRRTRSTSHGGASVPGRRRSSAISSSWRESFRASSMRGCWLVGPMKSPENRYESDGWLFSKRSRLFNRSGRRRGASRRRWRPRARKWLPPPVPTWRPVEHELLGPEPLLARGLVELCGPVDELLQCAAGWMFTSMTPGSA